MRIVSLVGARPQFVKLPLLSSELRKNHEEIIVHTGQHYDDKMSDIFYRDLQIPRPHYNLNIGSGSHGYQIGNMLISIEKLLLKVKPELVIIFGDTNSTVAASIAASRLKIPLAHVESGLRNYDKSIPEETNRLIADNLSDLLLCPTKTAVENLKREGIEKGAHLSGDLMNDVLLHNQEYFKKSNILSELNLIEGEFIISTIHRPRNTDNVDALKRILEAFLETDETIVLPLHPRTQKVIKENKLEKMISNKNIMILDPLGYFDFMKLLISAKKVVTDSGGIQKEAFILKKPCITLFNTTSWVETVIDGWNVLVESNKEKIIKMINDFEPKGNQSNHYGDGTAFKKICEIIDDYFDESTFS
ncbi:MAG: non-hydrolyzing UDP-N-acetylglucosamine 2-epimerase [Candidatus Hodarchaeales archaeon]|jgi:UDP-N-acetylglucosamine 2-epimerase